ncbi:MAG: hypothetical protein V1902_00615 [Candidatus Falkowbacteria bacterium]
MSPIGYRAIPDKVLNPTKAERLSKDDFIALDKVEFERVESSCVGHKETIVWYSESAKAYIVQVVFDDKPDQFAKSICTFRSMPMLGIDSIDGAFAGDIEAVLIEESLGIKQDRLKIFEGRDSIDGREYLVCGGILAE